jgi:hypothetical protein
MLFKEWTSAGPTSINPVVRSHVLTADVQIDQIPTVHFGQEPDPFNQLDWLVQRSIHAETC